MSLLNVVLLACAVASTLTSGQLAAKVVIQRARIHRLEFQLELLKGDEKAW